VYVELGYVWLVVLLWCWGFYCGVLIVVYGCLVVLYCGVCVMVVFVFMLVMVWVGIGGNGIIVVWYGKEIFWCVSWVGGMMINVIGVGGFVVYVGWFVVW